MSLVFFLQQFRAHVVKHQQNDGYTCHSQHLQPGSDWLGMRKGRNRWVSHPDKAIQFSKEAMRVRRNSVGQSRFLIKFTKPKGCLSMFELKSKVPTFSKKFRIRGKASLCWGWWEELVNELLLEDNQIQKKEEKRESLCNFLFIWWNDKNYFLHAIKTFFRIFFFFPPIPSEFIMSN